MAAAGALLLPEHPSQPAEAAGLPLDLRPFSAAEPMRARAPPPHLQLTYNPGAPGADGSMTAA